MKKVNLIARSYDLPEVVEPPCPYRIDLTQYSEDGARTMAHNKYVLRDSLPVFKISYMEYKDEATFLITHHVPNTANRIKQEVQYTWGKQERKEVKALSAVNRVGDYMLAVVDMFIAHAKLSYDYQTHFNDWTKLYPELYDLNLRLHPEMYALIRGHVSVYFNTMLSLLENPKIKLSDTSIEAVLNFWANPESIETASFITPRLNIQFKEFGKGLDSYYIEHDITIDDRLGGIDKEVEIIVSMFTSKAK